MSFFTDTALRLDSLSITNPTEGNKRKRDGHALLFLGLGSRGDSSGSFGISPTARGSAELNLGLDVDLYLGHGRPCKEPKSSSLSYGVKPKIDLELSLSTRGTESDLTSVTLSSSAIQSSTEIPAGIIQLVDEGSTSSKWKRGSLIHPLLNCQTAEMSSIIEPNSSGSNSNLVPPRKTTVKMCQFPGCTKGARGASGRCISHGGGRRCRRPGCHKGAEGRTAFCKAHGGGRRCEHLGCTKSAEGRTNLCIAHGGGRRCSHLEGCTHAARGKSGLCIRHGGGKRCKVENCKKSAEGLSGLCIAHGGGRRCQFPAGCTKGAQGSTKFCKAHGGGKRCTFIGCTKGAEGSTPFCKGHGGGKRCSFQGGGICTKSVHGGTLFCVAHGGGKRCAVPECTKSARGRTNFCVRHGGGKRCKAEGCDKSAQGSTNFCKAHGGGKRCIWGQPGSGFGGDLNGAPCDKFARGKIGLCATHTAQVEDKRVHGNGTVGLSLHVPEMKGNSNMWTGFGFEANEHGSTPVQVPEGRVHGGSLMAMLRGELGLGPMIEPFEAHRGV